jgi:hypothetical protein
MHNQNYKYRSPIGGLFAFAFLFFGVIMLVGFLTGLFRYIFWPFPLVGTIVFILIVSAVVNSARRRAYYRRIQRQQRIRYGVYRPTENPFWKNQQQVVQEKEQKQEPVIRVHSSAKLFCDYCGMKLKEEMIYCTNCGNKLN